LFSAIEYNEQGGSAKDRDPITLEAIIDAFYDQPKPKTKEELFRESLAHREKIWSARHNAEIAMTGDAARLIDGNFHWVSDIRMMTNL
jgi:hypothetical protein